METHLGYYQNPMEGYTNNNNMDTQTYQGTSYQTHWNQPTPQNFQHHKILDPEFHNPNGIQKINEDYPEFPEEAVLAKIQQKYSSVQNQQDDEFQKAQYELRVNVPMDQGNNGQEEYPEGELLPLDDSYSAEKFASNGNNGNNGNNYNEYAAPCQIHNIHPWGPLEDIEQPLAPAQMDWIDQNQQLPPLAPNQMQHLSPNQLDPIHMQSPATTVFDGSPMGSVNSHLEEIWNEEGPKVVDLKKVKNAGYSGKCLEKKRQALKDNKFRAENLQKTVEFLDNENTIKENGLRFVVDTVLTPLILDNNSNHLDLSPNEVLQFHQNLEAHKQTIVEGVEHEMQMDQVFIDKEKTLQQANADLGIATYDKDHKKERAPILRVSETTLGTRHNRAKMWQETCYYDHQAALHDYKLRAHRQTETLLNDYWEYFKPSVIAILNDPPQDFIEKVKRNGQMEQLHQLHKLLFKPG